MTIEPTTRVIVLAVALLVGGFIFIATPPERAEPKELGRLTFFAAMLALLWALCVR